MDELWNLADVEIGGEIEVQIVNKHGDRNLDGYYLKGKIVAIRPDYKFVKLDSGWCCHTKDRLVSYRSPGDA